MIPRRTIQQLYEARTREAMQSGTDMRGYQRGAMQFLREFHETMGCIIDDRGKPGYMLNGEGQPYRPQNCAHGREVSIRHLAEAICGPHALDTFFHPTDGVDFGNRHLLEAAIDPTTFLNINVFNLSVAGLINAEIMERWQYAKHIGDQICTIKPTNMNGQKIIGVQRVGQVDAASKGRQPGEPHAEIGFGERYQTTPVTVEQALKVKVTREAVFFDLTGQVLDEAGAVGDEIGYGEEKDAISALIGVTNSYNYAGTSYNTYQGTSPWINTQANPFSDWQDVDDSRILFVGRVDPDTGKELQVDGLDVLVMPQKEWIWRHMLTLTQVVRGTQNTGGNFPAVYNFGGNPLKESYGGLNLMTSVIAYNLHTAAASAIYPGLGISASNAAQYWYHGDFKKALWKMQNWPLTPWQAAADELMMKDFGLIAVYGANTRYVMYMREPRYINQNTN